MTDVSVVYADFVLVVVEASLRSIDPPFYLSGKSVFLVTRVIHPNAGAVVGCGSQLAVVGRVRRRSNTGQQYYRQYSDEQHITISCHFNHFSLVQLSVQQHKDTSHSGNFGSVRSDWHSATSPYGNLVMLTPMTGSPGRNSFPQQGGM